MPMTADPLPANEGSAERASLWRIIDANLNRCGEGLRVVEEVVRLGLDDRTLTEHVKQLRHDLGSVIQRIGPIRLAQAPISRTTFGREATSAQEYQRTDLLSLLTLNWKRVQQGLRTLEESLKLSSIELAQRIEAIRYRSYLLEQATTLLHSSRQRLDGVRLCVLVDARPDIRQFAELIRQLVAAGVGMIQLRVKSLDDRGLMERGKVLSEIKHAADFIWIMNDRADLATIAGADGVHLGQSDLSVQQARRIIRPSMLIGVSTHSLDQARRAVLDGASYIGVGPVFTSRTKTSLEAVGTSLIVEVASATSIPSFSIGGISADNLDRVLAAGAGRVAIGAAICQSSSPGASAAEVLKKLNGADVVKPTPELPQATSLA